MPQLISWQPISMAGSKSESSKSPSKDAWYHQRWVFSSRLGCIITGLFFQPQRATTSCRQAVLFRAYKALSPSSASGPSRCYNLYSGNSSHFHRYWCCLTHHKATGPYQLWRLGCWKDAHWSHCKSTLMDGVLGWFGTLAWKNPLLPVWSRYPIPWNCIYEAGRAYSIR